jgi:hypothetical protein
VVGQVFNEAINPSRGSAGLEPGQDDVTAGSGEVGCFAVADEGAVRLQDDPVDDSRSTLRRDQEGAHPWLPTSLEPTAEPDITSVVNPLICSITGSITGLTLAE